ncbi:TetR/AcrR family transcriptional regulator [Nocardia harenae]|uniref:TetR/AcrR family transcriptional regulator n=1 Tax=Nocardia harenae TaxID=358707 RepID=UPI000829EB23|nr:TetR/AcrR family transcriptional regulator [Nocardia harenae]
MTTHGPRERLLLSAITLMCRRGVHATGLAELLTHSRTARGSIYQHFPGGKSDLMEQATRAAGRTIDDLLDSLLGAGDPAAAVEGMIGYWEQILTGSDFAMGCPILAAAQAGPTEPGIQAAAAEVFLGWTDKIAAALQATGAEPVLARSIASTAISSIEGAIAQARTARTTAPLDQLRPALTQLIAGLTAPTPEAAR